MLGGRKPAVVIATSLVVFHAVWLIGRFGGEPGTQAASNLVQLAAFGVATIACAWKARREAGRSRAAWSLLCASQASWTAGTAIWSYYELVARVEVPFPSTADAGFLLAIPLAAGALLTFPHAGDRVSSHLRTLLDGVLIAGALLFVSWLTVLAPSVRAGADTALQMALTIAYPAGDLVIVAVAVFVLARVPRGERRGSAMVGTGLLALGLTDSAFIFLDLNGAYATGNLIDLGWTAGAVIVALGALTRSSVAAPPEPATRATTARVVLPYSPVVAAAAVGVVAGFRGTEFDPFLIGLAGTVLVLLLARQLVTLLENIALTRDLESKVQARTAQLRASEERFRSVVQNASDVITIVGADGVVTYQAPSIEHIFGLDGASMIGSHLVDWAHPADQARLRASLADAAARPGTTIQVEYRILDGEDRFYAESLLTNLLEDPSVAGIVVNTRNVSDRHALEDQLTHQALHDPLTGLANRALFRDRTEQLLARVRRTHAPAALLTVDLDDFTSVNDTLGHAIGDELLVHLGARLEESIRPGDTVGRLGGDEFAMLLEEIGSAEDAEAAAGRVLEAVRKPFKIRGRDVHVRPSVGLAMANGQSSAEELMRSADVALSLAKAQGKNRAVTFHPSMHAVVIDRLSLQADLRRTIGGEQLVLHFQPIVDLATQAVKGLEALMRWQHPERGLVSPGDFIPLAEQSDLIVPIGAWAMGEACRAAVELQRRSGQRLSITVNVSTRQLRDASLLGVVGRALDETGLAAEDLTIELTESQLMHDPTVVIETLHALKRIGVRLAIDDFGTGYSSLSYLGRLPVDILKVDRSFVATVTDGPEEAALARAIIKLARTFNLATIAEGIERPEEAAELIAMGSDMGQGFYFARPMPLDDAAAFVLASVERAAAREHEMQPFADDVATAS